MDTVHGTDNRKLYTGTLHSRATRSGVVFGVRVQEQQQQQQQEEQTLRAQRSLEVDTG